MFLSLGLNVFSQQVDDFVFLESGYSHQSYYSFANEEVANVDNTDWDLAFDSDPLDVSIRINGQIGTELYVYQNGDISNWDESADTTGLSTWSQLYDSDFNWSEGAFNTNVDPSNTFDYGWGVYNPITHHVVGDSLYIIKLSDGSFKKLWIESMISNVYSFRYADLDGSNEVIETFAKSDYSTKNYGYYSIQNETAIDREPDAATWDILFTKYIGTYEPGVHYPVTGVLHNKGLLSSQADNVDVDAALWTDFTFSDTISIIGYDWKTFNLGDFTWAITPDQCFFVVDQEGLIWKIIFTEFIGSSTGEIDFLKEQVGMYVGIDELNTISEFTIYPNPLNNGNLTINFVNPTNNVQVKIIDLSGKQVYSERLATGGTEQSHRLDLNDLSRGVYLLSLENGESVVSKKLIIN